MAPDPYRALGLPTGATEADVKRAYRRLAKANHPDSAGEAALPRFLEIQRAYEQLTTTSWRPGMRRPAPPDPWRGDPARARGARASASSRGAGASGGSSRSDAGKTGASGGAADAGRAGGTGDAGRAGSGPATGSATGPRPGPRPGPRSGGHADGSTGGGPHATSGSGDGSTRRRGTKKATFGSTTYDEAHEVGPTDTSWSGAAWYGPTSGEYWQVNPREYADPRKHGPGYIARAAERAAAAAERRARRDVETAAEPVTTPRGASPRPSAAAAGRGAPSARPSGPGPSGSGPSRPWPPDPPPSRDQMAPRDGPRRPRRETGQPLRSYEPERAAPAAAASSAAFDAASRGRVATATPPPAPFSASLPPWPASPGLRRLLRAVIAWPPLGIAAAAIIGEKTGCAGFEATCTTPADLYPWLAQVAILLGLLALPSVARLLAGGTVAVAILAFPAAAVLSATGANYDRLYGPTALITVLAVGWMAGVAAVVLRRAFARPVP